MPTNLAPLGLIAPVALATLVGTAALAQDLLLIPDSGNDRIWALSALDGSVVDAIYVPADDVMSQPIQIAVSPSGTLLITDELDKAVYEYSATTGYIRTLASTAEGVLGAYGLCIRDGFVYFTSGASATGVIYKVALAGGPVTVFSDWTGVGQPRGIIPYGSGFLVGNSTDDDLELVLSNGTVQTVPFHDSDGFIGIDFPQQIWPLGGGNVLVAGFSDPYGLYFYDSQGLQYGAYLGTEVFLSPRGCAQLDNGDYMYTGGTRIDRIAAKNGANTNIVNQLGTSFRWITRFTPPPPCPADLDGNGTVNGSDLAVLLGAWGGASAVADLNADGVVNASDLAVMLGSWGPC
jgi:hypothetical protein